ncbi:MAG TPA: hypothetical protein VH436_10395 [Vicinamibacterales bacterium]
MSFVTASSIAILSTSAYAQDWIEYLNRQDAFTVNFPSQPKVADITYKTEYGLALPGHVYTVESGKNRYSITVVDLADTEKLHTARADECKKKGGEGDACQNDWRVDVQGAIVHAAFQFFQRNAKVTHYSWYVLDQVEGNQLQLANPDGSRTFAAIHRHGTRLYILEATVPKGAPAPGLFQQSLQFLDEEGKPLRYRRFYTTGYSEEWKFPAAPPPRAR